MKKNICVAENLREAPRPIYLVGEALYEVINGEHLLLAKTYFPTSVDSIADRANKHLIPHVNVADAFFGVWNGAHIICNEEGYHGTLSNKGNYEAFIPIPPDEEVTLELAIKDSEELTKGRFDVKVNFSASYLYRNRTLMNLSGEGYAIRKK